VRERKKDEESSSAVKSGLEASSEVGRWRNQEV